MNKGGMQNLALKCIEQWSLKSSEVSGCQPRAKNEATEGQRVPGLQQMNLVFLIAFLDVNIFCEWINHYDYIIDIIDYLINYVFMIRLLNIILNCYELPAVKM